MKILVCGAGEVGAGIAEHLSGEGNEVVVVDRSAEQLKRLAAVSDIKTVEGKGGRPDILKAAGGDDIELIIAITRSDEENLFICQIAKEIYNIPTRIARVRDLKYLEGSWQNSLVGQDKIVNFAIFPEREVALSIAGSLRHPATFDAIAVAGGESLVFGIIPQENSKFDTLTLKAAEKYAAEKHSAVLLGVLREGALIDLVQADKLQKGDGVYFCCKNGSDVDGIVMDCGRQEAEAHRIVLASGGAVSSELVGALGGDDSKIKVLERDKEIAAGFCKKFPKAEIFVGDASSPSLLEEVNVGNAGCFIALTGSDETNIFSALMARYYGCRHRVILINNPKYAQAVRKLDLGTVINPKSVTVSRILQHVRRGKILAVHSLVGHVGEIIEFQALENTILTSFLPDELELPPGVRIAALKRGDELLTLTPKLRVLPNDAVSLFVAEPAVKEAEKLFTARAEQ